MNNANIADSFRIMGDLGSHFAHLTGVSISPDGRFLSSSDQNGVLVVGREHVVLCAITYCVLSIRSVMLVTCFEESDTIRPQRPFGRSLG